MPKTSAEKTIERRRRTGAVPDRTELEKYFPRLYAASRVQAAYEPELLAKPKIGYERRRRRCHGGLWLPPRFCFSPEYLHADVS